MRAPGSNPFTDAPSPAASSTRERAESLLYTPAEAAELLRIRESWLRRKAAAGAIPRTMLGKHLRFSPADLATIIDAFARPAGGRRTRRRRPPTGAADGDLPKPAQRSVHAQHPDNRSQGSTPWRG